MPTWCVSKSGQADRDDLAGLVQEPARVGPAGGGQATGPGSVCRARLADSWAGGLEGMPFGLPWRPRGPGWEGPAVFEGWLVHRADWRIASDTDNLRKFLSST
jgi:hypothetical protein